jgi:hypothetical protein
MTRLRGSLVERFESFGREELDAVVAAILIGHGRGTDVATVCEPPERVRSARFEGKKTIAANELLFVCSLTQRVMVWIVVVRIDIELYWQRGRDGPPRLSLSNP